MKKIIITIAITAITLPLVAAAREYVSLISLPGPDGTIISPGEKDQFNAFIDSMYALSISLAALLAVIKIIIAGVKWMMTDIISSKSEAKKDIYSAMIGLLLVLSAVLILTIVNPQTVNVDLSIDGVATKNVNPLDLLDETPPEGFSVYKLSNYVKPAGSLFEASVVCTAKPPGTCKTIGGIPEPAAGYPMMACYFGELSESGTHCYFKP